MRGIDQKGVKKKIRLHSSPQRGKSSLQRGKKTSPTKMRHPGEQLRERKVAQDQIEKQQDHTPLQITPKEDSEVADEEQDQQVGLKNLTGQIPSFHQKLVHKLGYQVPNSPGLDGLNKELPEVIKAPRRPQPSSATSAQSKVPLQQPHHSLTVTRPPTYGEPQGNFATRIRSRVQTLLSELSPQPRSKTPGAAQQQGLAALAPELPARKQNLIDAFTSPEEDEDVDTLLPIKWPPPEAVPNLISRLEDIAEQRARRDSEFWYRRGGATARDLCLGSAPSAHNSGPRLVTKINRPQSRDVTEKSSTELIQAISMASSRREALRKQLAQWLRQDLRRKKKILSETANEAPIHCKYC